MSKIEQKQREASVQNRTESQNPMFEMKQKEREASVKSRTGRERSQC